MYRRDLSDLDLFEREIPFDLGDLSARDDADLYTRDFFETELLERDPPSRPNSPSPPSRPNSPPSRPNSPSPKGKRDLADDSDLLERDFEELKARESIWTKIR